MRDIKPKNKPFGKKGRKNPESGDKRVTRKKRKKGGCEDREVLARDLKSDTPGGKGGGTKKCYWV